MVLTLQDYNEILKETFAPAIVALLGSPSIKLPISRKTMKELKFKLGFVERWEEVEYPGSKEKFILKSCYTPEGYYIGRRKDALYFLKKMGLIKLQPSKKVYNVCSIGYQPEENKWYGWSHRAMVGFGIGDKIFIENYGNEHTTFKNHGRTTIKNMRQAKIAAQRFANYIS